MQPDYNVPQVQITDRQQRNRKVAIITAVLLALAAGAFAIISNYLSYKTITLKPNSNVTMRFGTATHGEAKPGIDKELAKATTGEVVVNVKPGVYAVVFSGDGIRETRVLYEIKSDTVITAPSNYRLTDDKLSELLDKESTAINAYLKSQEKTAAYTPQYAQLYQNGTWYAAKLVPADPVNQDTVVVVLQKENGSWKLAAGPEISLYLGNYPNVPEDIIKDINNRQE